MAKAKLDFSNPLLSAEAVGSLSNTEEREPTAEMKPRRKKRGTPKRNPELIRIEDGGSASQDGLTKEYTRFSCICKVANAKKVRDYAYTTRRPIKQVMDEIIEAFFEDYDGELLDHEEGKGN